MTRTLILLLGLMACVCPAGETSPAAELRLRDTSWFAGTPFHFYIRILGVDRADPPLLGQAEPDLQIRYLGATSSNANAQPEFTFTYEALPLRAGSLLIPATTTRVQGQDLATPARPVDVAWPSPSDAMELKVSLSHSECFVGEPVRLAVTWTTALSLNGIKAVDLRIPLLTDSHFQVHPPLEPVAAEDPQGIGLPVSNQRMIARYRETTLRGAPAIELSFEQILRPQQPSPGVLKTLPATLLCSYAEPARAQFQGTRYPSHFNNDFFDQDVTGTYQRLFVQAGPVSIQIKPWPTQEKPPAFSGIVGAFALSASAAPLSIPARSPVTLKVTASGYAYPHLLQLPPWKEHLPLTRAFLLPGGSEPERGRLLPDGRVEFSVSIRPRSESVSAIPSLEFVYFDPAKQSYETVRTPEIPLSVSPSAATTVYDLEFADGSKLRNPVEPVPGGLTHNAAGSYLLVSQSPQTWTLSPWLWLLTLGLPPLAYLLLRHFTREYREALANPELARRRFAFRRFRRALQHLPENASPFAWSHLLRVYFSDRFGLDSLPGEVPDLHSVALQAGLEAAAADSLASLITQTDMHTFARNGLHPGKREKQDLLALVHRFERNASRVALAICLLGLTLPGWGAPSPEETLREGSALFERANEAATTNPAQAQALYRLAAARFEQLVDKHGIRNGYLYYNLGNTYLLAGDLGRATVNYLRGRLYLPTHAQLDGALREARLRQVDEFPQVAPARLRQAIFFWHYHLGPRGRFLLVAATYISIWSVLALSLFFTLPWKWKACSYLGAVVVLAGTSSLIHARSDPRRAAVIVQSEVLPRKGDAQIYDPAFTNPLHSGAEITILEQRRDWLRIQVNDGSEGWIPSMAAERVVAR